MCYHVLRISLVLFVADSFCSSLPVARASRQDAANELPLAIDSQPGHRELAHISPFSPALERAMLSDGRLRSAWLMKLRGQDSDTAGVSAEVARAQLQAHFAVVEQILLANTSRSLAVALARLELSLERQFTRSERLLVLQYLATQRTRQIARLDAYRYRGRFPLNQSYPGRVLPIFVDSHDTACAVGHLMRQSGWQAAVAGVHSTNNLVYVPQVNGGPVWAWILQSGLTQEEAALVQPGYPYPAGPSAASIVDTGGERERAGLRLENLSFEVTGNASLTADGLYLGLFKEDPFVAPFPPGSSTHGLNITADSDPYSSNFGMKYYVESGQIATIRFSYDLRPSDPEMGISQFGIYYDSGLIAYNQIDPGGTVEFVATIYDGDQPLETLSYTANEGEDVFQSIDREAPFDVLSQIHVESELTLSNGVLFDAVPHGFRVTAIPEPSSFALAVVSAALALCGACQIRRRRRAGALGTT